MYHLPRLLQLTSVVWPAATSIPVSDSLTMFAGPSPSNHVNSVSPQHRLSDNGDDAFSALYGCGAATGRCSNRPGSEWVTLSKTLLLQLVERICQLSFQTEVVVASAARQEPIYRHVIEPETDQRGTADVVTTSMEIGDNSSVTGSCSDRAATPSLHGGSVDTDRAFVAVQDAVECSDGESRGTRMDDVERTSSSPVDISMQRQSPAISLVVDKVPPMSIHSDRPIRAASTDDDVVTVTVMAPPSADYQTAAVATPGGCKCLKSPKIDRFRFSADDIADNERTAAAASACEQDQNVNTDNTMMAPPLMPSPMSSPTKYATLPKPGYPARRDRRHTTDDVLRYGELVNRRRVLRAHRRHSGAGETRSQPLTDVSRDVIANCRTAGDDVGRVAPLFLHTSRPHGRRIRHVQQPWMALNKSVVYRMLDVVLSQSTPSLPSGGDVTSATAPISIKRPAKNRIWNPAISSAPSSPEYTSGSSGRDTYYKDDLNRDHAAVVSPPLTSPTFDAARTASIGNRPSERADRPAELPMAASPLQSDAATSPSILRDLLDGSDPLPVASRRCSETAVLGGAMAPSAFVGFGLAFSSAGSLQLSPVSAAAAAVYQRRRHHSAGRDGFVPDGWLSCTPRGSRLAAMSQEFHNSLMFVDNTRGRDIYNYMRSPDGHPIIASASLSSSASCLDSTATPLDYTVQTLGREQGHALGEPDWKSKGSLPEIGRARPGVTPRWVAFNKGDVSTLFESLATAMMAADATTSTGRSSAKMATAAAVTPDDDDDMWRDSTSPPLGGAGGSSDPRHVRARLVGGSVDSVFRRPLVANEPLKWKSSLMRRMRDEVQAQKAEQITERKSPSNSDGVIT